MKKLLAIFLTMALIVSPAFVCALSETTNPVAVVFPESVGFEDYDAKQKVSEENPVSEDFTENVNDFSYLLAAKTLADMKENVTFSPLSLYFALALSASGAEGETREALFNLLAQEDGDDFAEQHGNFFRRLYTDDEIGRLKIANSVWLANEFDGKEVHFNQEFLDTARSQFYTDAFRVDFKTAEAGEQISEWIGIHTGGQLNPEIKTADDQIMTILNTIDYQDEWIDRFNEGNTRPGMFHLASGDELEVDFMHEKTSGSFVRGKNYARASRHLKHGSMVFILPNEDVSIQDLVRDEKILKETLTGGKHSYGDLTWQIPKFDLSSDLDLADHLKSLGLSALFEQDADFSRMIDHLAFISEIKQQSRVAIDENGVSAAAFTQIDYCGAAPPSDSLDMILDRPFLFAIYGPLNTLMFVGIVENPNP
ncbi:MAG TPA: serpin family protein [Fastidiosipila sp.]|nr:serpin family protein [Fastidiosipila sp.]